MTTTEPAEAHVLVAACTALGGSMAALVWTDGAGGRHARCHGAWRPEDLVGTALVDVALRHDGPIVELDPEIHLAPPVGVAAAAVPPVRFFAAVPLRGIGAQRSDGILCVAHDRPLHPSAPQLALLELVGRHVTAAWGPDVRSDAELRRDIEGRARREGRFEAALAGARHGVCIVSATDTAILFANRTARRVLHLPEDARCLADEVVDLGTGTLADLLAAGGVGDGWRVAELDTPGLAARNGVTHVEIAGAPVSWRGEDAVQIEVRDVSATVADRRALRLAEQRLHTFDTSPVGAFEVDAAGRVTVVNGALERMLDAEPGTLVGLDHRTLLADADGADFGALVRRLAAPGATAEVECVLRRADGVLVPASAVVTSRRAADGEVEALCGTVVDVSDRERARLDVIASRHELAAAQRLAGVGSWAEDVSTGVCSSSEELRRLLAVPDGVELSRDLILSLVDAAQREELRRELAGLEPGRHVSRDVRLLRWDGVERTFAVRAERGREAIGPALRAAFQDVTDARRLEQALIASEERAKQLIVANPDAIIVVDADGRIREVNQQTLVLLGHTRDELIGRPVEMLIPAPLHAAHRRLRAQYQATADPRPMSTGPGLQAVRRDGSTVDVDIKLSAVALPDGPAVVATVRDETVRRTMERRLREANEMFASVLDAATEQSIVATDESGLITVFNRGAERMLGWTAAEMVGVHRLDALHEPAELARLAVERGGAGGFDALVAVARTGAADTQEWTYRTRTGDELTVLVTVSARVDADGAHLGFIAVATDITARRRAESALLRSEERFRLAFDDAPIGMALVAVGPGQQGRHLRVNRALCELTGYSVDELLALDATAITHPDDADAQRDAMAAAAAGIDEHVVHELRYIHAKGDTIWARSSSSLVRGADGRPDYLVSQFEDITVRRQTEAELTYQALHDPLTGLANRVLLNDHLDAAIARAARSQQHLAVLFIDLDDFKVVNDSLGHDVGDALLVTIADRLAHGLRETDTAGRLGGDEFVLVCGDLPGPTDAVALADRLVGVLSAPVELRGHVVRPSVSVGIATGDGRSSRESLLRHADAAMYRAKRAGKGRYELVESGVTATARRRLDLERDLLRAVEREELRLAFQPCVDLVSGRIVGAEALLRWQHPVHGLMAPADFLGVAEDRGLIVPIGRWALGEAFGVAARWSARFGADAPRVWVNVSARQLGRADLLHTVRELLELHGLDPSLVGIELTERQVLATAEAARSDLNALPTLGVGVAIDDVGTGHASLDYLRTIKADTIKVDRSFVSGLGEDPSSAAFASSVIELSERLDLTVVAEGVETAEQRDVLIDLRCRQAQGYLFSRPVDAERFEGLLLGQAGARSTA